MKTQKLAIAFAVATVVASAAAGSASHVTPLSTLGAAHRESPPTSRSATPSPSAKNTGPGAASRDETRMSNSSGSSESASFVQPGAYSFKTIGDAADPTFNQLLGINNGGVIAGYFGSGAQGHPNMGFRTTTGGGSFANENVAGTVQTQVVGINNRGVTVGFSSTMNNANQVNDNTGFYALGGSIHPVAFPTANNATPKVNQLLGVNDADTAVGFYTDAAGNNHGYEYSIGYHTFYTVTVPGATSTTAAAINNFGEVAGFFTGADGVVKGFLLSGGHRVTPLAYPGASMTQATGLNNHGEVVGLYQVGTGSSAQTHGFTWTVKGSYKSVDDPNGVGTTTVNGVNDAGVLVGFYVDGAGNTDGMLATPGSGKVVRHLTMGATPTGTVTLSRGQNGLLAAQVNLTGLTPGSSHTVEIDAPWYGSYTTAVVLFSSLLTANSAGVAQTTLYSTNSVSSLPYDSRFVVLLGQPGYGYGNDALAAEPIARTGDLSADNFGDSGSSDSYGNSSSNGNSYGSGYGRSYSSKLSAVDVNTNGVNVGPLNGQATVVYDAAAKTLTVTMNASGLTPGAHASHIHTGSCQSQGGVLYMMMDFQANSYGNIVNQTRVITGVNSMPANGTWYLNLHQGDSNTILANGAPALPFRPLLCGNG